MKFRLNKDNIRSSPWARISVSPADGLYHVLHRPFMEETAPSINQRLNSPPASFIVSSGYQANADHIEKVAEWHELRSRDDAASICSLWGGPEVATGLTLWKCLWNNYI